MENNSRSNLIGRRQSMHLLGMGITATSFLALAACKQGGDNSQNNTPPSPSPANPPPANAPAAEQAALSCATPIDAASTQSRKIMQYKNPAAIPEKHCSACSQYIAGKYGDCGGCKLFTGPVNPNGGCLSFAPKSPDGVAAPAKSG